MRQFQLTSLFRHRRFLPLLIAAVSACALVVPATFSAIAAEAAPAAGYTASFIPVGTAAGLDPPSWVGVNPATGTVYTWEDGTEGTSGTLIVINGSSGAIVATLPFAKVPDPPDAIVIDSATDTLYASFGYESTNSYIDVISGASNTVSATIPLRAPAIGMAVDSATNTIYATDLRNPGSVFVVDGTTNKVTATYGSGGSEPAGVAVDEATGVIWVANEGGTVAAISEATGAVEQSFSVTDALGLAVDPDTDTVYVTQNELSNTLTVINAATGESSTVSGLTDVGGGVAVDPSDDVIFAETYAASGDGTVVIDGATNTVTDTLSGGVSDQPGQWDDLVYGYGPAVDTATGVVYVAWPEPELPGLWAIAAASSNGISPLIVCTPSAATALTGTQVNIDCGAGGLPAPTLTENGPLPSGVTFNPSTGLLSGTPAVGTAGVYSITFTASNGVAPDYSLPFVLTVEAPTAPMITSAAQVTFAPGVPSSFTVTATGLPTPTISESGTLPDGVTFSDGVLSGTPLAGTGGTYSVTFTAANSVGSVTQAFTLTLAPVQPSTYVPLRPVRVLDTRNGTGGYSTPVGPGGTISLPVTGVDGVPATGVTAVVLNVTATDPTASSYVTVWPDGTTRPVASSLNFTAGDTIPNLVTVPVGADGAVDFYNNSGSTDLVADLEGYYTTSGGSFYDPAGPVRVLDTRNGTGGYSAPVGPGATISLQITGAGGVPATGVTAVVLNVTATDPTASSYITVYPDGTTRPVASSLNVTPGQTIPNLVVVPVGADGRVDFYNNTGSTDLVADLEGYYTTSGGSSYVPVGPVRVLDTRNGTGAPQAPVGPGGTISLQIDGAGSLPASGVTAVVLNVTATDPTASSYLTVYPDGDTRPTASSLNFTAGETIPNLVVVPVGADGQIDFYNNTGSTDLVADLEGYYTSS